MSRYAHGAHFVDDFERRFADMLDVKHVVAVNSGTAALTCALAAAGVGPGDEVLVPAYTWMATAAAPVMVGAVPVLVDIDESLTMDPADMERKITPQTRAVMPVHMINLPCDMERICAIARQRGILVIEDACQAVGVRYKGGYCGAIGDIGAFSFNYLKNMNIGEGGAFATNDPRLFARGRNYHDLGAAIRGHESSYNEPAFVGANMRLTELEGAMLNVQLSKLRPMIARMESRRKMLAKLFSERGFKLAPHHDPASAASLVVLFDTPEEAVRFAERPGVTRVFDNSKHIYTNWDAIISKRTFHPAMNPWAWARRDIDYGPEVCARSIEILSRACRVALGQKYPGPLMRVVAERITQPL